MSECLVVGTLMMTILHAAPSLLNEPVSFGAGVDASLSMQVTIVDPHVKRDTGYYIHDEATAKGSVNLWQTVLLSNL